MWELATATTPIFLLHYGACLLLNARKEDKVLGGFEVVLREESLQGPFSRSG